MQGKGIEYRQHTIHWAVSRIPGSEAFNAKGSISWTDVSGVFHLHPMSDISGRFNSVASAETRLIDQARHWIDERLRW
jgi:hypothetical protein